MGASGGAGAGRTRKGGQTGGGGGGGARSLRAARREEREFWERMSSVVSEPTVRVWSKLEEQLVKYNKVLKERADCIDEVQQLRNQNESLKALLTQYLGAKVNEEL